MDRNILLSFIAERTVKFSERQREKEREREREREKGRNRDNGHVVVSTLRVILRRNYLN